MLNNLDEGLWTTNFTYTDKYTYQNYSKPQDIWLYLYIIKYSISTNNIKMLRIHFISRLRVTSEKHLVENVLVWSKIIIFYVATQQLIITAINSCKFYSSTSPCLHWSKLRPSLLKNDESHTPSDHVLHLIGKDPL